jgi:ketosteroid isomerase-like protein
MSQENVEIVRLWFAALERGEMGLDLWNPDLTMTNVPEFPITGPYRGHDGLRRWWDELSEIVEGARIELDEATAVGDSRVLTIQRLVGIFSNSGIPVNQPWAAVFTVRQGQIYSASGYASRRRALKGEGLTE